MKKSLIALLILFNQSYAFHLGHHHSCICTPASCVSVAAQMEVAKRLIKINYKLLDGIMGAYMKQVKENEQEISNKQSQIAQLTTQIKKLQKAIALEDDKKVFLLKKIINLNLYKGNKQ